MACSLDGLRIRQPYVGSRLVIPSIAAIPRQLYGGIPFLISKRLKAAYKVQRESKFTGSGCGVTRIRTGASKVRDQLGLDRSIHRLGDSTPPRS